MSEWPQPGDKMRFLARNGYEAELRRAMEVFSPGQVLTVSRCDVGDWDHQIIFVEVVGRWNGVMFELAKETPHAD